jgi:TAG lipase/steryl ester hydrolase/phospholipase A2/LPA acyltransferase
VLKARSSAAPPAEGGGGGALFGGARPREAALKEAGRDFIKEDLALSRGAGVRRAKRAEEKAMEETIDALRAESASAKDDAERAKLESATRDAEIALTKLALELDDEVRFSQRDGALGSRRGEPGGDDDGEGRGGDVERRERPRRAAGDGGRERDLDRGWGEGKPDRGKSRGGSRGGSRSGGGDKTDAPRAAREQGKKDPRERFAPRVFASKEQEGVKIAPSGFAALEAEDE